MRTAAILALASVLSYGAVDTTAPQKPKSKSTTRKKSTTASSARRKITAKAGKSSAASRGKTTAKAGTSSKKSKTAARRRKKSGSASTWRTRQSAPTPDRYREIQSALAQRGYLKKDASGVWDADSADALRRFQQDQSLDATGKLDSLSLIALGLGPKHNAPAPAPSAPPHVPEPQTPATVPPVSMPASEPPAPPPPGPVAPSAQL